MFLKSLSHLQKHILYFLMTCKTLEIVQLEAVVGRQSIFLKTDIYICNITLLWTNNFKVDACLVSSRNHQCTCIPLDHWFWFFKLFFPENNLKMVSLGGKYCTKWEVEVLLKFKDFVSKLTY